MGVIEGSCKVSVESVKGWVNSVQLNRLNLNIKFGGFVHSPHSVGSLESALSDRVREGEGRRPKPRLPEQDSRGRWRRYALCL